jgi:hypothetical protein
MRVSTDLRLLANAVEKSRGEQDFHDLVEESIPDWQYQGAAIEWLRIDLGLDSTDEVYEWGDTIASSIAAYVIRHAADAT